MLKCTNMRILFYHPVRLPVLHYGGTERVAMWLVTSLHRMGHLVTVFAAPGSVMPEGIECITDPEVLARRAGEFDLLHGFSKPSDELTRLVKGNILVTIHGNGQRGEKFHRNTVFLSQNHAKRHGATCFVYNGLDADELLYSDSPRPDRYLFLSKTSWKVKNLAGAVSMVSRAHQNLWIAGGDRPYLTRARVALKKGLGQDWSWVGSVNQEQKAKFLLEGKAMVFPLLWNEPFGLVITESLVSGTPVLANAYGSVPELLEFAPQCLMKSEADWAKALKGDLALPSAKQCRDWVLSKFEMKIMTKNYLSLYEKVLNGQFLNEVEPETKVAANEYWL